MLKKVLVLVFFIGHVVSAQVGVGTTDPKSTLEVVGNPSSATSKDGFIPPKLQRSQLIAKTGYGVDQTGAVVFVTDVSGTTNTATVKVTTAGYYYWDGDSWEPLGNSGDGRNIYTEDGSLTGDRIVTQGTSNLSFTSTASSGTSHFSVDGSTFNVNAVANNVGIGTSNPLFPLHVQSNVFGFSIDRHNTGPGNQSIISLRKNLSNDPSVFVPLTLGSNIGSISFSGVNGGTTAFGPYVPLGNATRILARAEENFTPTSAASELGFYTTPTGTLGAIERLTIKGNGNVGIGTTTPTAQFHTTGTVRFAGAGTPTLGRSLVTDATGLATWQNPLASNTTNTEIVASATQVAVLSTNVQGAISDLATAIKTTQNSTIYTADGTLTSNRTVAQGANSLTFTGTAVSDFNNGGIRFPGNMPRGVTKEWNAAIGDVYGMEQVSSFQTGTTAALRLITASVVGAHIAFGKYTSPTAFTEFGRFTNDGNFGIGTTSPNNKLTVASLGNNYIQSSAGATTNIASFLLTNGGINRWSIESFSGVNDFRIWKTDNTYPFTILQSNGNVGIATINPQRKLEVNSEALSTPPLRLTQQRANTNATNTSGNSNLLVVDNLGDVKTMLHNKEYAPSNCSCTGSLPYTLPANFTFFGQYDGDWNGNGAGNTTSADLILPTVANSLAAGHKYGSIVVVYRGSGYNVVVGTTNTDLPSNYLLANGESLIFVLTPSRWKRINIY